MPKRYHVFVGQDEGADACLFVAELDEDYSTNGKYMSEEDLKELAEVVQKFLDSKNQ